MCRRHCILSRLVCGPSDVRPGGVTAIRSSCRYAAMKFFDDTTSVSLASYELSLCGEDGAKWENLACNVGRNNIRRVAQTMEISTTNRNASNKNHSWLCGVFTYTIAPYRNAGVLVVMIAWCKSRARLMNINYIAHLFVGKKLSTSRRLRRSYTSLHLSYQDITPNQTRANIIANYWPVFTIISLLYLYRTGNLEYTLLKIPSHRNRVRSCTTLWTTNAKN